MSKEVSFGGWISIIPDKMIKSWIKSKYIPNSKVLFFSESGKYQPGTILYRMDNPKSKTWDGEWVTKDKVKELKKKGWIEGRKVITVKDADYRVMRVGVYNWYDKVFDYVEGWLFKNNLLHIQTGSLQTGFCVENDSDREVVKTWGAPLAKEGNKVVQMKEKFGQIRIYFCGLTDEEDVKVKQFAREVEKKFDCETLFC